MRQSKTYGLSKYNFAWEKWNQYTQYLNLQTSYTQEFRLADINKGVFFFLLKAHEKEDISFCNLKNICEPNI